MITTLDQHESLIASSAFKEKDLTQDEVTARQIEWNAVIASFPRFLKWAKVVEAPTLNNPGGAIQFQLWPHLKEFVGALTSERLISVLKSRQIGASWLVAAWVVWNCITKEAARWMLYSKGEAEAIELLSKGRRIYQHLPPFMRAKILRDSTTELSFANGSIITAMAATESAGVSFQASGLVWDEHEQHPYAEVNYSMAKPTIDAGGQVISVFTVDRTKPKTLAKRLFRDGLEGKNGYKALFFPYTVRPGRDEEWYASTKKSVPVSDLGTLTPEMYMAANYPRSIEEALSPLSTITAFDHKVLDFMRGDTRSPLEIKKDGIDPKVIHIYKDYSPGALYVAATDTSHGVGKDYSVTLVMNVKTGEVVADILSNAIPPDELARQSVQMLGIYGNPMWWPEDNDWGAVVIKVAKDLGYRKWGYQDKLKTKIGFSTKEATRDLLWGEIIAAVNSRQLIIYNIEGLSQFYDVIRNIDKNGRIEAQAGGHDDYPMAVGIAWLKRSEVGVSVPNLGVISTLTFRNRSPVYA